MRNSNLLPGVKKIAYHQNKGNKRDSTVRKKKKTKKALKEATKILDAERKKDDIDGKKRGADSIIDKVNKNTIIDCTLAQTNYMLLIRE